MTAQLWLRVASEFSEFPGGRAIAEGDFSGEDFRKKCLSPRFKEALERDAVLYVDLDGVEGFATSFLEEAFGGLAREYGENGPELVNAHIEFKSEEVVEYINECRYYIRVANDDDKNSVTR